MLDIGKCKHDKDVYPPPTPAPHEAPREQVDAFPSSAPSYSHPEPLFSLSGVSVDARHCTVGITKLVPIIPELHKILACDDGQNKSSQSGMER